MTCCWWCCSTCWSRCSWTCTCCTCCTCCCCGWGRGEATVSCLSSNNTFFFPSKAWGSLVWKIPRDLRKNEKQHLIEKSLVRAVTLLWSSQRVDRGVRVLDALYCCQHLVSETTYYFLIGILVKTCLLCLQELLHSVPWLLSLLLLVVAHLLSQIVYEEWSSRLFLCQIVNME